MSNTLIIDRKDLSLGTERNLLKISIPNEKPKTIPLKQFSRIVVSANINLESRLLRCLARDNISLIIINPRKPDDYGLLIGAGHKDGERRIKQFRASETPSFCYAYARYLVKQKIQGQHQIIQTATKTHPQHRITLYKACQSLERALARIQHETLNTSSLLGIEGAASAVYFGAYSTLFPNALDFSHRNRRPPLDPVNALLSLSYTLASGIAANKLRTYGYDLLIGFYHKIYYSRQSLCADIIEPARPVIDTWVYQLCRNQELTTKHFRKDNKGCFLEKTGRQIYYANWEKQIKTEIEKTLDTTINKLQILLLEFSDSQPQKWTPNFGHHA